MEKMFEIGALINTKNYGSARVLGPGSKYNYWRVKFLNTGHEDEFRADAVRNGECRDKYAVTFCGVGIIGNIKTRGKYKRAYTLWRNMIARCYKEGQDASYYNKVSVCDRWLTFEYFYQDIPLIDGYSEDEFHRGELCLDKDLKQKGTKHKVYSRETCTFVSKAVNDEFQEAQQRPFMAISPTGEVYQDYNITRFGREHGLERRQISAVLHGRVHSSLGWKFHFVEEDIV